VARHEGKVYFVPFHQSPVKKVSARRALRQKKNFCRGGKLLQVGDRIARIA